MAHAESLKVGEAAAGSDVPALIEEERGAEAGGIEEDLWG
jgi:hypothetical protein